MIAALVEFENRKFQKEKRNLAGISPDLFVEQHNELIRKEQKIQKLENDIKILQDRLKDRSEAYEAKDMAQVKEIQKLKLDIIFLL